MLEVIPGRLPHLALAEVFDTFSYYSDCQCDMNGCIERNRIPEELIDWLIGAL